MPIVQQLHADQNTSRQVQPIARRLFCARASSLFVATAGLVGCNRQTEPIQIFQIEQNVAAAELRITKFRRLLDRLPAEAVRLTTLRVDIGSEAALERAMGDVLDVPRSICVAGSGLMADVAARSLKHAVVLFATQNDPVQGGLVRALERPGVNRTGFTFYCDTLPAVAANLQSLKPKLARIAVLTDAGVETEAALSVARFNALNIGVQCVLMVADNDAELEACFQQSAESRLEAWVMKETKVAQKHHEMISAHLAKNGVMSGYDYQLPVERGGLMGYSASFFDPYAVWVRQISLILSGVPVNTIPVETPQVFKLYLNLDTARRMGIAVPKALIKSAERTFYTDQVR